MCIDHPVTGHDSPRKEVMVYSCNGKGHHITGPQGPKGGVEVCLYSYSTSALGGGGWSAPRTGHFTPGKYPVPIVQEAGWPQGRSGGVRKISPPPGFDPRTVQTAVNRYTD
jgi:hypothetical protein